MAIDILGIDVAKNVFQLHGVDRKGNAAFKRRFMRDQLDTSKNRFLSGAVSVRTAFNAFDSRSAAIFAAREKVCRALAAPVPHAAAYFPDSQTKRRML